MYQAPMVIQCGMPAHYYLPTVFLPAAFVPMFLHLHEDTVALQVHVPEIQPATDHLPRPCVPIYNSWEVSLLILRY